MFYFSWFTSCNTYGDREHVVLIQAYGSEFT
jgi:hypothetical protein